MRRPWNLADESSGDLIFSQKGPWPEEEEGEAAASQIPAAAVAGGEGDLGEKHEGTEIYLMVASVGVWGGRKGVPRRAVALAAAAAVFR